MVRKTLTLTTLLLAISATLFATQYTTNIEIKSGEKWWGVFVGGPLRQPFTTTFDTSDSKITTEQTSTLLLSSTGRYLWSKHPAKIYFDGNVIIVTSQHEDIKVEKGGNTLREAYLVCHHKNTPPSGNITGPKELMSAPVYDISLEMGFNSSQQAVVEFARKIVDNNLPKGTIVICDGWQSPSAVATFDNDYYPDAKQMVETLHQLGFKIVLEVSPTTGAYGRNFESARRSNTLLCNADGSPTVINSADGYVASYDIANDQTIEMFDSKLRELISTYKVDGFKLNCATAVASIADPQKRAAFVANWNKLAQTSQNNILLTKGTTDGITIAQIDPIHSGYEALRKLIQEAITSPLSGAPLRLPTINTEAFDKQDEMLRLRAMQLLATMPIGFIYSMPWNFSDSRLKEQAEGVLKFRKSIEGYINECIDESARSAEPLIRHMTYQFARNGFTDCSDQFMLGSRYLIAPVLDDTKERTVRLPKGEWTAPDGKRYKGPLVRTFDVSKGQMLYFELSVK